MHQPLYWSTEEVEADGNGGAGVCGASGARAIECFNTRRLDELPYAYIKALDYGTISYSLTP